MPKKSYDVIIVGGGLGGLNLAALLAHVGKKVLVLERGGEESLGGRAVSGRVDGAAVDNGIKGLIMVGSQDEVYRRIGKQMPENVCEWTNSGELYLNGEWHKLDDMIKRSFEEFIRVYKRGAIDMTYEEVEALDDISIEKYVTDTTDNQDVIDFFRYLGWLFGGTRPIPTDYSAGSLFYSIKKQVEANGHMPTQSYWAKGGSGAIATGLIEAINENGGDIRTGTNVSRVVIEEGRVKGVEIEEGERVVPLQLLDTRFIEAPVVVSAVSIWDFLSIVSEDDLPPWYVERIKYLQHQTLNLGTVTYAMDDEELWDHSGQRWVQQGPVSGRPWCASSLRYAGVKSRYQVSFWIQLGWWEKPNFWDLHLASHKAALKKLFEDWEADIEKLFPKVVKNALWKVRSFGPAAMIETPGNVGSKLIDIEAEGVEGLYLVGDRTSVAKVTGVYGTATAALAAYDLILNNTLA
jgi:glycine/D-amino acid oxidase-like deaminating enzyme